MSVSCLLCLCVDTHGSLHEGVHLIPPLPALCLSLGKKASTIIHLQYLKQQSRGNAGQETVCICSWLKTAEEGVIDSG